MDQVTKENLILAFLAAAGTFAVTFFALHWKPSFEKKIREAIK